jgi:hypothetical protein
VLDSSVFGSHVVGGDEELDVRKAQPKTDSNDVFIRIFNTELC